MQKMGDYIRSVRESKKFSMEYMAGALNISYPSYHAYEANKTNLLNPRFLKICELLEIDPCDLIEKTTTFKVKRKEVNNVVGEPKGDYLTFNIKQLRDEIRERDETIGALKYQLTELKKKTT